MSDPDKKTNTVQGREARTEKPAGVGKAVALKYDPLDVAPKVVAKGSGFVADKILEHGRQNKVPVYQDPKLVEELTKIDLGSNIPPELYEIVAQVLIFISDLDRLEGYKRHVK